jgi:hypothetical protein
MQQKKLTKHLTIILEKMFEGTGIEFSEDYVNQDSWYLNYAWPEVIQENYTTWLTGYLYNNAEARKELMNFPQKNLKQCKKVAEQMVLFFGWTTIKTPEITETKEENKEDEKQETN